MCVYESTTAAIVLLTLIYMGDLLQAKPCLWRDGSAEQGGVVAIEGLEGGVVGREVTRTWFPARKKSQELQQFRLYFHRLIRQTERN